MRAPRPATPAKPLTSDGDVQPTIAVGGLSVLTTGLVHHAEAVVAVVDLGEPHLEVAGGLLGLVELAGTDEVGSGVGRNGQLASLAAERIAAIAAFTSRSGKR